MANRLLVVFTNSAEGREQDFRDWYVNTHLAEVSNLDGFISGQLYTLATPVAEGGHRHMAVYEIEEGKLANAQQALGGALKGGTLNMTDAFGPGQAALWWNEESPVVARDAAAV